MAKTFKEYLKEISDQQMKDMSAGNAYNGGKSIPKQKKKAKAEDPKSQERKDAAVAKMDAEDKAARKAQADKFAAMKNEDLENNVLTTVENESGERHVVEVPIDHFKVNEVEVSDEMRGQINQWINKFSKYIGGNGDTLPEGYMQWALNSGIATDFVEQNEAEAMRKKYGEDEFENDPMSEKFQNEMPITKACLEMIEEITGDDDIDTNARMIDTVMNPNTIKVRPGDADESTELDRIKELAGASIDETYDDDDDEENN